MWTDWTSAQLLVSHLHFHHMDGVPASFNLLGSIASLLDENDSSKSMIQVPEVHRGHTTLKVTRTTRADSGGSPARDTQWWLKRQTARYSQVSVLIESIVSFDLQLPQADRRHCTIVNRRVILITPWRSKRLKNRKFYVLKKRMHCYTDSC